MAEHWILTAYATALDRLADALRLYARLNDFLPAMTALLATLRAA